jgi:hypothetical protein
MIARRSLVVAALWLAGCTDSPIANNVPIDAASSADLAIPIDEDLGPVPDLAVPGDLASADLAAPAPPPVDMQVPSDLRTIPDLAGADFFTPCTQPPAAFRMRGPISASRATSRTPKVQWFASDGAYRYHVDFCDDRTCASKVTVTTGALSAQPPSALTRGAHFWRVTAESDCGTTPSSSGVWELWVGGRSATINTAHFGFGFMDTNQDGRVDVAAASYGGTGWFYLNNAGALAVDKGQSIDNVARPVASIGDFNGDGFGDLLTHDKILPGSSVAAGLGSALSGTYANGSASQLAAGIGDFDNDGYADFAIYSANEGETTDGTGTIFFGNSADTLSAGGNYVVGAGDVNGDGIADVAIAQAHPGTAGVVKIYHGGARSLGSAATTLNRPAGETDLFGIGIAGACDVNGDGYADLLVATQLRAHVYVYYGSASGIQSTGYSTLSVGTPGGYGLVTGIACAGDVNGDGYDDVVAGDPYGGIPSSGRTSGRVLIFHGGSGGLSTTAATIIDGNDDADFGGERYGYGVAGVGDINGDGYDDIATVSGQCDGKLIFFKGGASGIVKSPALYSFSGPSGATVCYGTEIAWTPRLMCGGGG